MDFLKKSVNILLMLFIFIIFLNIVFASDNVTGNVTCDASIEIDSFNEDFNYSAIEVFDDTSFKASAQIQVNDINSFYKEKNQLVSYLTDINGTPIKNKTLTISLNGKDYSKTTDSKGKVVLDVNLKPNTYKASVKFSGDDDFNPAQVDALVKIKKAPLRIKVSNLNTYENSDVFFKAKVYNRITNSTVAGIRVAFKVYSSKTKRYTYYYGTTNKKGMATLNNHFKVGSYKISAQVRDSKHEEYISYKNSKQVRLNVKLTPDEGCCSFYLQISNDESVAGFRRDSIVPVNIYVKSVKWHGRTAIRQYKTAYSYFFHSITTSDGWRMGNGGLEDGYMSKAIENLAGDMVKSNKIKKSVLNKIQMYKKKSNFGHFSIKAPNGRFAVVWKDKIITGKLKPGQYFSSPNDAKCYRQGTYAKFDKDPIKAAIKIGATDNGGTNRRCISVFHWKAMTSKNFKTTSLVKAYVTNDDGKLVGKSTAYLKDNFKFKDTFFSKKIIPKFPKSKFLGTHKFGNIDKLIKTPTIINASNATNKFNATQYFKITVKNKNSKKVISGVKIKIQIISDDVSRIYTVKTNEKGVAKLNTKSLQPGNYSVIISPANNKYLISAKTKITIEDNY